MYQERGQEITSESTGATVSSSLAPSTPTKASSDPDTSLTSSPSSPSRSQGPRPYPQKPPIHPRRASQSLSIKSTSSPPRDKSVVPITPPSPGMISPITSIAVKGAEASLTRRISTTYKPYLSRSSSTVSAGMPTQVFSGAPDVISTITMDSSLPLSSAPHFSPGISTTTHTPQQSQLTSTQPMVSSSKLSSIKGYIAEKGGSHRHTRVPPAGGMTAYGLYSAYSTSTSASTPTSSVPPSGSASSSSPSSNTPQSQPQPQPQYQQNLSPSYPSYTPRQSWRSWATDKLGSASAKVQAGAAIVVTSASAWKESREQQRDGLGDDGIYYNHHQQQDGPATASSKMYQRRGSKDAGASTGAAGDEKGPPAASGSGSGGANTQANPSGCATVLAPGGVLETLHVFPGWGVRRYRADIVEGDAPRPFDIELYVSGFAIYSKTPETASRSQRAFVRLAKGFASLPKLPILPNILPEIVNAAANVMSPTSKTPPPIPPKPKRKDASHDDQQLVDLGTGEATESRGELKEKQKMAKEIDPDWDGEVDAEAAATEARMKDDLHDMMFHPDSSSSGDDPSRHPRDDEVHSSEQLQYALLSRLHENLERRLLPFWSSVLANRTVKIGVWLGGRGDTHSYGAHSHSHTIPGRFKNIESNEAEEAELLNPPLVQVTVQTAADGSFSARVWVSWEELCIHPKGVHMAFGEDDHQVSEGPKGGSKKSQEHEVEVWVEMPLIGSEVVVNPHEPTSPGGVHRPGAMRHSYSAPSLPLSPTTATSSSSSSSIPLSRNNFPTLRTHVTIPITHTPIRVLSDIDDTIKSAGVLSGARAIFHNVFVKDLRDIVIPGMGEWYAGMWILGVRFHYVSNGPFEILPVVNEFFQMAQLPPGSIKLRSYAGRSLFNGLLSAPAARKRQGVIDILESFKDSRFILVGDTGEQDLELYAEMARERPHQILAVFVRDVMADTYRPDEAPLPIDDPTGWGVYGIGRENATVGLGLDDTAGVGLGLGGDTLTPTETKNGGIMEQDVEVPPRYFTSSPTMELDDEMGGDGKPKDLDATPKPNKFPSRLPDSPSIGRDGPTRRVTAPPASSGSLAGSPMPGLNVTNPRRISCEENASTAGLLDGISVPKPQYNPRPSATTRLKEALAGSRPGSRSSTRSGSGVIDKPPTPTAPPIIPTLVRSSTGLGTAIALPNETSGGTDYFTSNKQLEGDYESDSGESAMSSLNSEETASTSSAEWGQSQWRGGKRRRMKKKLGLTRTSGSRSSGGSGGGGWRGAISKRSTGSGSSYVGGAGATGPMSETERKRAELQSRVYRARTIMPSSVPLRIFRDPAECIEAEDILRREGMV